jgi:formiminotetrahydrofolate cyclodeaminase
MDLEEGIRPWLDALASASPAPGGGAVAALSAASAASLVAMTCRATLRRPVDPETSSLLEEIVAEADRLAATALGLMASDGEAYGRVIAARRLPKASDPEKAERRQAIDAALLGASEVPLAVARAAATIIALADRATSRIIKDALPDLAAAIMAAETARAISLGNARTNLGAVKTQGLTDALKGELAGLGG